MSNVSKWTVIPSYGYCKVAQKVLYFLSRINNKTMPKKIIDIRVKEQYKYLDNLIFPSTEDNGVEHIDESYKDFLVTIENSLIEAYENGRDAGYNDGYEAGQNDADWEAADEE